MPLLLLIAAAAAFLWVQKTRGAPGGVVAHPIGSSDGMPQVQASLFIPAGTSLGFGAGGKEFVADGHGGLYRKSDGAVPESGKVLTFSGHTYVWTLGATGVWDSQVQPDAVSDFHYAVPGSQVGPPSDAKALGASVTGSFTTASLAATGPTVKDSSGLSAEERLGLMGLHAGGLVLTDGSRTTVSLRTVPTTNSSPIIVNGNPTLF